MENMVGQPQTVQVPNYSGVNIQIFNPSVAAPGASVPAANINSNNYTTTPATAPVYPANYYTQNFAQPNQNVPSVLPVQNIQTIQPSQEANGKKTETREIVELSDNYIKTIESYLNDQNKEIRLMGAKEVLARLQEDNDRKNDEALTALINKMLQDPYQPVKFIAMGILESRAAAGNDKTVALLQNIQKQKTSDGQDSLKAANVLLKMSGTTTKKEFEASGNSKKKGEK